MISMIDLMKSEYHMFDMADIFNMANVDTNLNTSFSNLVFLPEFESILKLFKLSTLLASYSHESSEC